MYVIYLLYVGKERTFKRGRAEKLISTTLLISYSIFFRIFVRYSFIFSESLSLMISEANMQFLLYPFDLARGTGVEKDLGQ